MEIVNVSFMEDGVIRIQWHLKGDYFHLLSVEKKVLEFFFRFPLVFTLYYRLLSLGGLLWGFMIDSLRFKTYVIINVLNSGIDTSIF